MASELYLFCDLDRTVLPNGRAEASPEAEERFRRLVGRPEVFLGYVSGRDRGLLEEAIEEYGLPEPDVAVGDVGTTIYWPGQQWKRDDGWWERIAKDWNGVSRDDLGRHLENIEGLEFQPDENQGAYKLSFFTPGEDDDAVLRRVREALDEVDARSALISSYDEQREVGLLDILPEHATKCHAVAFLLERFEVGPDRMLFAGDSGNDIPALTSGWPAVLVANASEQVREAARVRLAEQGIGEEQLYFARGGFLGMNGNYAAGILEGLVHFYPHTRDWIEA